MSRSYWRICAAIGVTFCVSVAIGIALQPKPYVPSKPAIQKEIPGYHAGGYDCQPSQISRLTKRKREQREAGCAEAEHEYREETNSLIQGGRQADASETATVISNLQTRIAAWGVSMGFATMIAAIAAAWFAMRAAEETQRGAEAAKEAVEDARESSREEAERFSRQMELSRKSAESAERMAQATINHSRPYVVWGEVSNILKSDPRRGPTILEIPMNFINYGQSPARMIEVHMGTGVVANPNDITFIKYTGPMEFVLQPSYPAQASISAHIPSPDYTDLVRGNVKILFGVMVKYRDLSGTEYVMRGLRRLPFPSDVIADFGGPKWNYDKPEAH